MHKIVLKLLTALAFLFPSIALEAREPYDAGINVDGINESVDAPNLFDLMNDLKEVALEELFPLYSPASAVSINFNFRGIASLSSFAAGSTTLNVVIPQAGITESFTGETRDDSLQLYRQYLRDGAGNGRILKAYSKYSPIDPIAGNPNSLMAQMAQSDYMMGHLSPLSGCDCCWSAQPIRHEFQVGSYVGRAFSNGYDTTIVTLPLRYSYSPRGDWAFIIDAPITYNRNGGASSIYSSLGTGVRIPVASNWSLTPIARFGAGGSLDLCTAGDFFAAGLNSVINLNACGYVFSVTNYAGYYSSANLWLSGVNFNYHLQNYIFKNGFSVNTCEGYCLCGRKLNFSFSFIDSYFARDTLYMRHYDEIQFNLITTGLNPCLDYDCLSLGFAFQFGQQGYRGYFVNLFYQF